MNSPEKQSPSQSRPGLKSGGSGRKKSGSAILTTANSLNPVLRINRNAGAVPASTSTASANAVAGTPSSSPRSSGIPVPTSSRLSSPRARHRKTSSTDSLRRHIETQRASSPSPLQKHQAAGLSSAPSTPTPLALKRSSSSSSSLSSQTHRTVSEASTLSIRPVTPAPAVHTDLPFPASPTTSILSTTSTSNSFDVLKSSLRETLQHDGQVRERRPSNSSLKAQRKRRSVSFAEPPVDASLPPNDTEELLESFDTSETTTRDGAGLENGSIAKTSSKVEEEMVNDSSMITFSPVRSNTSTEDSTSSSPISSTLSSPVSPRHRLSYPIKYWEPLSPNTGEITEEERANLASPFEMARGLFSYMHSTLASSPLLAVPKAKVTENGGDPKHRRRRDRIIATRSNNGPVGQVQKAIETLIGLFLATIWLAIGRILGTA